MQEEIKAYISKENETISNYANMAAILSKNLKDVSWVGFYLVKNNNLYLGPFMGKPACMRIGYGKGVCGTALKEKRAIIVPDVREFKGHIACSSTTLSELVIPVYKNEEIVAILDLDSDLLNRFNNKDLEMLENCLKIFEKSL